MKLCGRRVVKVCGRLEFLLKYVLGLLERRRSIQHHRLRTRPEKNKPGVVRRRADDGVVALAPGELEKDRPVALLRHRKFRCDQQLAGLKLGLEQSLEELFCLYAPFCCLAFQYED